MKTEFLFRKAATLSALLAVLAVLTPECARADDAAKRGAEPGRWTQDYAAAVALSKERNLPLFLKFTGSDWCGWCMLMEKQVFSEKEFQNWAKDHIVLVSLDFPRGKNAKTVPDDYKERNRKLAGEFGVSGFPTYFILSPGGARLGQMGARRDYTAKDFLKDLQGILDKGEADLVASRLSPEERAELERLRAAPAEREKAKAELAREREDSVAEGRRKMNAAVAAAKAARDSVHDAVLADYRVLDQKLKDQEEDLSRASVSPAEREKAKAALARQREEAIAEGRRKTAAAESAANAELEAKRNEILAGLRKQEEGFRAKEAELEAQAKADAARLGELEAKLK